MADWNRNRSGSDRASLAAEKEALRIHIPQVGREHACREDFPGTNRDESEHGFLEHVLQDYHEAMLTGSDRNDPARDSRIQSEGSTGNIPKYTYGTGAEAGLLKTLTVPGGNVVTFVYEAGGPTSLLSSIQDWSGRTWTFQYDPSLNLTTFTTPTGSSQYTGNFNGLVSPIENRRGFITTHKNDGYNPAIASQSGRACHPAGEAALYRHVLEVGHDHARHCGMRGMDLEDCASEFLFSSIESYCSVLEPGSGIDDPEAYLHTCAFHFVKRYRQRLDIQSQRVLLLEEIAPGGEVFQMLVMADPTPGPDRIVTYAAFREAVHTAITSLRPALSAGLEAILLEDRDVKEIAQAMGCSESTLYHRLVRARPHLIRALAQMGWTEAVVRSMAHTTPAPAIAEDSESISPP